MSPDPAAARIESLVTQPPVEAGTSDARRVSVVLPARNEAAGIGRVLDAVRDATPAGWSVELIVVDDGSADETAAVAEAHGARVLRRGDSPGNPAAARNLGARAATGDPIVFLDADCTPAGGWLEALLAAHAGGAEIAGGSLDMPPGLDSSARCDYYASCYHLHPRRGEERVPSSSPANLSVRRALFTRTGGFTETLPVADGHEELGWQADAARRGAAIRFVPHARVFHHNRCGYANMLRRSYRWGYSALQAKSMAGAARAPWVYRWPRLMIVLALPLAPVHALYTLTCWVRAGVFEPVRFIPGILAAKLAYGVGFMAGGARWLRRRGRGGGELRPRWR